MTANLNAHISIRGFALIYGDKRGEYSNLLIRNIRKNTHDKLELGMLTQKIKVMFYLTLRVFIVGNILFHEKQDK